MRLESLIVTSLFSPFLFQLPGRKARSGRLRLAALIAVVWCHPVVAPCMAARPDASHTEGSSPSSDAESLPPSAQASISATIGRDQVAYHAAARPQGVAMKSHGGSFDVEFSATGFDLRQGADRWGMALKRLGHGQRLRAVSAAKPRASANRVEYRRGDLTEWYENGPLGLEQGFTLARAADPSDGGPLTLAFELSGGLAASLDPGARGLTLERDGAAVLRYDGLTAVDARGAELPAWLELDGARLLLRVDDAGAEYPVTIDPVLQAIRLTNNKSLCSIGGVCDFGSAGDRFGFSVAISDDGNTVAVAAPHATGSNVDSGAVYVFRKPAQFGWGGCITVGCLDFTARLTSTPGLTQHGFGAAVAMSGDASTIAVLTDTLGSVDSSAGIVYVYQRPSTGWASTGQHAAILSLTTVTEVPCGYSGNATDCLADFTSSIDVDGDGSTIVLGYSGGLVGGLSRGAVYVFARPIGGWVDSSAPFKLTRSAGAQRDLLGQAVSISADDSTIVASAPQANGYSGVVDLFLKGGSGWANQTQSAELTYAPGNGLLFLGNAVDVNASGTIVVAGGNGRALIFAQPTVELCTFRSCVRLPLWVDTHETAHLTASDGSSIARPRISNDGTRVVAAGFESPGMLYAFIQPATGWASATEGARFGAAGSTPGDLLGYSSIPGSPAIDISGNGSVLVAGAPGVTVGSNANQGAAYIFLPEPGSAASLFVGALALSALESRRQSRPRRPGSRPGARASGVGVVDAFGALSGRS